MGKGIAKCKSMSDKSIFMFSILICSNNFSSIHRNDESPHRRAAGRIPETYHIGQTAYVRGDRFGSVCVSADGETVHGVDNNENVKHSGGFGNTSALLESGIYRDGKSNDHSKLKYSFVDS